MSTFRILLPCVSVAVGAGLTLLIADALTKSDPVVVAAELRFRELSVGEASRIKATYDRLRDSSTERTHVESIHRAVTGDDNLESQLQRVYEWWLSCDEEQRQDLRALTESPHRWVSEVQRQFADNSEDSVAIFIPNRSERGRRAHRLQVSLQQVDRFLEDALPSKEAAASDLAWLETVEPEDLRLARLVVVADSLFSGGGRLERPRPNQESVSHVFAAATEHLLGARRIDSERDPRILSVVCFSILHAIKDRIAPEFVERLEISAGDLEDRFATMDLSDRVSHMLSDPKEAAGLLNARLKASERDTPAAELAQRLIVIDRAGNRIRGLMRGGPRDGGWRGERGRRERGPGRGGPFGPHPGGMR